MWVYGLDWAGPGQGRVAEACECGNELSGSVKCGEFLCKKNMEGFRQRQIWK